MEKVMNEKGIDEYCRKSPDSLILQAYMTMRKNNGVMYYRFLHKKSGTLIGDEA